MLFLGQIYYEIAFYKFNQIDRGDDKLTKRRAFCFTKHNTTSNPNGLIGKKT